MLYDDGVTVEMFLSLNTDEPFKSLEVVMDDSIIYLPCEVLIGSKRKEKFQLLRLSYIHGNIIKSKDPVRNIAFSFGNIQN